MKRIKVLPGIVLISVCDEHLLVATREAREKVAYVQQINSAAAYYWKLIEDGMDEKIIVRKASEHFKISPIQAFITFNNYIKRLSEAGYLIIEEEEDK